jgi:hypothetical protein
VCAVALEQQEGPAAGVKRVTVSLLYVAVVLDGAGCVREGEARKAPRGGVVQPARDWWDKRQAAVGFFFKTKDLL